MTQLQKIKRWFDIDYQLTKANDEIIELKQQIAALERENENLKKSKCDHIFKMVENSPLGEAICEGCGYRPCYFSILDRF